MRSRDARLDARHPRPSFDRAFLSRSGRSVPGKVVIYGGTGGIGGATARALKARNFDLHLVARDRAKAVQAALPALRAGEGGASVVLFSTVAVAQGFAAHASVAMAKGAVEGLTLALAAEFAPKVRVNAVAPSLTRTNLARSLTANEAVATGIAQMHALPRLGQGADSGALAAFLISDEASWITGQIIGVDGGRSTLRT